jgi:hypothetical protein
VVAQTVFPRQRPATMTPAEAFVTGKAAMEPDLARVP